jgi:hypothetical protein
MHVESVAIQSEQFDYLFENFEVLELWKFSTISQSFDMLYCNSWVYCWSIAQRMKKDLLPISM